MNSSDPVIHDFFKDVAWSENPAQYIRYMQAIIHWWPNVKEWDRITDLIQQKQGKDITILLNNGDRVKLQFKARRTGYGDFLVEYRHDYPGGRFVPGWIEKDSDIDYLIYCPPKWTYRIEWKGIVAAWGKYKNDWTRLYDIAPAPNKDYDTRNVAVPWDILKRAGVEADKFEVSIGVLPKVQVDSGIHWPGWGEGYHPTWPKATLEQWVSKGAGTKAQIERYKKDIAWYNENAHG